MRRTEQLPHPALIELQEEHTYWASLYTVDATLVYARINVGPNGINITFTTHKPGLDQTEEERALSEPYTCAQVLIEHLSTPFDEKNKLLAQVYDEHDYRKEEASLPSYASFIVEDTTVLPQPEKGV